MLKPLEKYLFNLEMSLAFRLRAFYDRYCSGEDNAYLYLAAHAAFPIAMTPDLLYKIWLNFRNNGKGEGLHIPIIAISDLLFSTLYRATGRNTFEMPDGIRAVLLHYLQDQEIFGVERVDELAHFLDAYLQENPQEVPSEAFQKAQEYIVTARFQPELAAERLIKTFNEAKSIGEIQHLLALAEAEVEAQKLEKEGSKNPLVVATELVRGIQEYKRGNVEKGLELLKRLGGNLSERANGGIAVTIEQNVLDALPQGVAFSDNRPLFFGVFLSFVENYLPIPGVKKEKDKILEAFKPVIGVNSFTYINCSWDLLHSKAIEQKDRVFIFHYAGHCVDGNLIFKDQSILPGQLSELLVQLPSLKLVFLNTDTSASFIDKLHSTGIEGIITVEGEISDLEGQEFARWFYTNLVATSSIPRAFESAARGWKKWIVGRLDTTTFKSRPTQLPWRLHLKNPAEDLQIEELLNQIKPEKLLPPPPDRTTVLWEAIVKAYKEETIVTGTIIRVKKGGFTVDCGGLEAFLPGSQVDIKYIFDFNAYIGKIMDFKVVKIDETIKNAVLSHKVLIESKRKTTLAKLGKGQVLEGIVKNIADFGAFLDLGGVDGLLYITDISWGRINHPSEVLNLNQKISVVVMDFDENKKRISLGLKQLQPHPWEVFDNTISENSIVKGKIVSIEDYGAFLEIQPGVEGLIHISEISWSNQPVNTHEFFKLGQEYSAKVVTIDRDERKMSFSLKQMVEDPWSEIETRYPPNSRHTGEVKNLTPYGVFIELAEGIGGMVHISELSWTKRYGHPSEFTKMGKKIEVVILSIDNNYRQLTLSHKQLEENPWDIFENVFPIGSYHETTVLRRDDRGAIVQLPYGLESFAPIKHIRKDDNTLAEVGEILMVKVIEFNRDDKRILVSHLRYLEDVHKKVTDQIQQKEEQNIKSEGEEIKIVGEKQELKSKEREEQARKIEEQKRKIEELKRKIDAEQEFRRKELEEQKRKEEQALRRKELEELKKKEEQALRRKELEELKKNKEIEELKIKEEQELKRKEIEELNRREEQELRRKEIEDLKNKEVQELEYAQLDVKRSEARFVLKTWLYANRDIDKIRPLVIEYLQFHAKQKESDLVLKAWLNATGDIETIKPFILRYLQANEQEFETGLLLKAWLDANGDFEAIKPYIQSHLLSRGLKISTHFVINAWLTAKGDIGFIQSFAIEYLRKYASRIEAGFVFTAWIRRALSITPIQAYLQIFLSLHAKHQELAEFHQLAMQNEDYRNGLKSYIFNWLSVNIAHEEVVAMWVTWVLTYQDMKQAESLAKDIWKYYQEKNQEATFWAKLPKEGTKDRLIIDDIINSIV